MPWDGTSFCPPDSRLRPNPQPPSLKPPPPLTWSPELVHLLKLGGGLQVAELGHGRHAAPYPQRRNARAASHAREHAVQHVLQRV